MKKVLLMIFIICVSCVEKDDKTITSNGVGSFKLGEKLIEDYDKEVFEIKTSKKENVITTIVIKSDEFKTKEGFGIGSKINDIEQNIGISKKEMGLNKGKTTIGTIGNGLLYKNIWFIDMDKDNIVDVVWLTYSTD
ncbi:hypothetical protein [Winogradskyella sp.]|uniref:hypothetical protein n=1 Tax=Winogradskyella sp. TaxID=1883156 RepID=UPI003BAD40B6